MTETLTTDEGDEHYQLDPVYVHARREAIVVVGIFFVFAICTLTIAFTLGSRTPEGERKVATLLGMPTWVVWSIVVPWVVANIITGWFCFYYMADDPLDDGAKKEPPENPSDCNPSREVVHAP